MDGMPFPTNYKRSLSNKTKTVTIRIFNQIGKYIVGRIYSAKSYAGKTWGIKIKIVNIRQTTLGRLAEFGIPAHSIDAIRRRMKTSSDEKVDLIRFRVL